MYHEIAELTERPTAIASGDLTPARPALQLRVEIVGADRLTGLGAAWADLVAGAVLPNVFMSPTVIAAAAAVRDIVVVLVSDEQPQRRRLVGVAAFTRRRLHPWIRVPVLSGALNDHTYISNPVIATDCLEPVLDAMLDAIAASTLPKTIFWREFQDDEVWGEALRRVLSARGSGLAFFDRRCRPVLQSKLDGEQYFAGVSSNRRHNLRRTRKRLAEHGALTTTWHRDPEDVAAAVEEFIEIEGAGWKEQSGTALRCNQDDLAFTRQVTTELAARGELAVAALRLDGRAVAMWVFMRCGDALFAWKIGYDETLSKGGPGMLLLEDCTHTFLADAGLRRVDSCSFDDQGFIAKVWQERISSVDIVFDARRGAGRKAQRLVETVQFGRRLKQAIKDVAKAIAGQLR